MITGGELVDNRGGRFNIVDIDKKAMTIKLKALARMKVARKDGEFIIIGFADIGDEYQKPSEQDSDDINFEYI